MPKIRLPQNIFLKILVIILAVPVIFYVLPFAIGGFLIHFVFRHFNNKVLRNSVIVALLLPTLFIGTAWAAGFTQAIVAPETISISPTPSPAPKITPTATPIPTASITETPTPTPTVFTEPTDEPTPTPYIYPTKVYTPVPTAKPIQQVVPTSPPANNSGGGFSCNCAKTCPNMSSCSEAQYQLNSCGCSARDTDNDGIACDAQCQ